MRWEVRGANKLTGNDVTTTVEASNSDEAARIGNKLGLLVSHVTSAFRSPGPTAPATPPAAEPEPELIKPAPPMIEYAPPVQSPRTEPAIPSPRPEPVNPEPILHGPGGTSSTFAVLAVMPLCLLAAAEVVSGIISNGEAERFANDNAIGACANQLTQLHGDAQIVVGILWAALAALVLIASRLRSRR